MKKGQNNRPMLEEMIPDETQRQEILGRLYQGDPLLGDGGIFTAMLQSFVKAALEGEVEHHLGREKSLGLTNRRNGAKRTNYVKMRGDRWK